MDDLLRQKYEKIYDEMKRRNTRNILDKGYTYDPLLPVKVDPRRCFVICCDELDIKDEESFQDIHRRAVEEFPNAIIYSQNPKNVVFEGRLHHSLLQVVGFDHFDENESYIRNEIYRYSEAIDEVLQYVPTYNIKYDRMCALRSGIAMLGIPSIDINVYRNGMRREFNDRDLVFREPYLSDIAHSSFVRFYGENETNVLDFIDDIGSINMTATIRKFRVTFGTWKLNDIECEDLLTKELKKFVKTK